MDPQFALGVEYDGSRFHGWQRQPGHVSIQQALEDALSRIANESIRVTAAGRTDAGVHACQQVVAFATRAERALDAWVRGTNSLLPHEVRVRWARSVPSGFHARFAATARRYLYVFLESDPPPAIARDYVTWSPRRLDDDSMHAAARLLIGEHDFSSFRSAACQSKSPYRCIHSISVRRFADLVVLDVEANAFLHHMVRNVAGALAEIGRGERDRSWLAEVLLACDRSRVGRTAPANGLYLFDVTYGAAFDFPRPRPPAVLRAAGDVW